MGLEEIEILSAKGDFEAFKKGMIWADLSRELKAWKEGFEIESGTIVEKAANENLTTASVLLHMGDLNGRLKAVDYMLSLPDVLMSMIDMEKEAKSDDKD